MIILERRDRGWGRGEGRRHNGPNIDWDYQPSEIGMPYNLIVNRSRLGEAMMGMGFTRNQIRDMTISLKFREDPETQLGKQMGIWSWGRPLESVEGYGIEIRVGDMYRAFEVAKEEYMKAYAGIKEKENVLSILVKDMFWRLVKPALFSEIDRVPKKFQPRTISKSQAHALGRAAREYTEKQAQSFIQRRVDGIRRSIMNHTLAHELKHLQSEEEDIEKGEGGMVDSDVLFAVIRGTVVGFIGSAVLSQGVLQLAEELHIDVNPILENIWSWGVISIGSAYGVLKGFGWARDLYAHEDEAYEAGSKLAKLFEGAITLERVKNKKV